MFECPAIRATVFALTPSLNRRVTAVWRQSRKPEDWIPSFKQAGAEYRFITFPGIIGVPTRVVKIVPPFRDPEAELFLLASFGVRV